MLETRAPRPSRSVRGRLIGRALVCARSAVLVCWVSAKACGSARSGDFILLSDQTLGPLESQVVST